MREIFVIRHQESAPLGLLRDVFDERGVAWRYVDCWRRDDVPAVDQVGALIVLGGEMNADEVDGFPHLSRVRGLMRDAVDADIPVLGICLGAQVLARALGGDVYPSPRREIGFVPVRATPAAHTDPVVAPFAPAAKVFQFHEDTCSLPPGAELLFEGDEVAVQGFRAGERAYGLQFHLEVTEREIAAWCDESPDLEPAWGVTKEELLRAARTHLPDQHRRARDTAAGFLDLIR